MNNLETRKTGRSSRAVAGGSSLFLILTSYFLLCVAVPGTHAQISSRISEIGGTTIYGGRGANPTPTPAPIVDAQRVWANTGTDFNANASWTAGSGGLAPVAGDVAAFSGAAVTNPQLTADTSIAGLYFSATNSSGYTLSNTTTETLTLTGFAVDTGGGETGNFNAAAIGANNTAGNNTITAPIILAPSLGTNSTFYQAAGGTLTITTGGISGSGIKLTKAGGGTLTLNVASTYSGGTFINIGTVNFNNADSLGSGNVTLGTVSGGDATLTSTAAVGITNNITVASGSGGTLTLGTTSTSATTSTWSGTLTLNDNVTITSAQASTINGLNLTGAISGTGGITKIGVGLLTLSASNTYSGGTTVNAGTLRLSGVGTLGPGGSSLTVNGGTLDLNGTSQNLGALNGSGGTILNNNATASTLSVGALGASGSYSGVIANGTGTVSLSKINIGTLTLSGNNTYTGSTGVGGGTVLINGDQTAATGAVLVTGPGGTILGGTGTIGGAVTINSATNITGATNGTVGTLTLKSTVAFAGTSGNLATYLVDISGATSDKLAITGALNLSNLFDQITFSGTPDGTTTYVLATYSSVSGTFNFGTAPTGYELIYGATELDLTPVPEPSTWVGAALTMGAILVSQRRRLKKLAARNWEIGAWS